MLDFISKNQQFRQKNRMQVLLLFIAMMPMAFLQAQCPAVNVPYTQDFESAVVPALPDCTTGGSLTPGGSVRTFSGTDNGFTGKFLGFRNPPASEIAMMFTTPRINLQGNTTYKISYDYGTNVSDSKGLYVSYRTTFDASLENLAMHMTVAPGKSSNTVTFQPAQTGVYTFSFMAATQTGVSSEFIVNLDNIVIEAVANTTAPTITNFTSLASCGQFTALAINGINLANATVTIGGTPITLVNNTW